MALFIVQDFFPQNGIRNRWLMPTSALAFAKRVLSQTNHLLCFQYSCGHCSSKHFELLYFFLISVPFLVRLIYLVPPETTNDEVMCNGVMIAAPLHDVGHSIDGEERKLKEEVIRGLINVRLSRIKA